MSIFKYTTLTAVQKLNGINNFDCIKAIEILFSLNNSINQQICAFYKRILFKTLIFFYKQN